jgi:N-acetylglucosaminyldiphosphoundecaprenol N-acetyl-beta-D-mannosaminyltransferase
VAMTSPKKEYFLKKYVEDMGIPFTMGVGGSFDVIAGMTLRAPLWMQRAGLEWFFRFLNEPRRLWKRYFNSNLVFLWMLIKAFILGKKRYDCD